MRRTPPPDRPDDLSPAQRQRLRELLTRELRDAYSAALAAGASETDLAAELDERRRALAETDTGTVPETGSAAPDEVGRRPTPVRGPEVWRASGGVWSGRSQQCGGAAFVEDGEDGLDDPEPVNRIAQ